MTSTAELVASVLDRVHPKEIVGAPGTVVRMAPTSHIKVLHMAKWTHAYASTLQAALVSLHREFFQMGTGVMAYVGYESGDESQDVDAEAILHDLHQWLEENACIEFEFVAHSGVALHVSLKQARGTSRMVHIDVDWDAVATRQHPMPALVHAIFDIAV